MPRESYILGQAERRSPVVRVAALAFACVVGYVLPALGGPPGMYVNGEFRPLLISKTERVVEFESLDQRTAALQKLRTVGGQFAPIPWAESLDRFAIIQVPEGTDIRRLRTRELAGVRSINPVYRRDADGPPMLSSGRIVVRVQAGMTRKQLASLFNDYRVTLLRPIAAVPDTYLVVPVGGGAGSVELDTANALYRDARTRYAQPDLRMPVAPSQLEGIDDPFLSAQYHLSNDGTGGGTAGADINIEPAWELADGTGIIIGQFDDSCEVGHEDLQPNYIGVSQFSSDTDDRSATAANPRDPFDGHGTSTMGVMVAARNNGIGVVGVAFNSTFTASGGLIGSTTSDIANAFAFAREQGVDAHNNSWGFAFEGFAEVSDLVRDSIRSAFENGRDGLGMVMAFASGNGIGSGFSCLGAVQVRPGENYGTLPTVIGVGASNARDQVAFYSNFGPQIDVLAPSADCPLEDGTVLRGIATTDITDGKFPGINGSNVTGDTAGVSDLGDSRYTRLFSGTSAAAPQVTGLAALILSLESNFTASQVRSIIEQTCDPINPDVAQYNGITRRSLRYGYGRINAGRALEAVSDGFYWPQRVADVRVVSSTILWNKNEDLRQMGDATVGVEVQSVLVVESNSPFSFAPQDGTTYAVGQEVAPGAFVVANSDASSYTFTNSGFTKFFGIYTSTNTPQQGVTYGFGVAVNSDGATTDPGSSGESITNVLSMELNRPNVSINVSPLSGPSPLRVSFSGNAQSDEDIASFVWDFDDGTSVNQRQTEHTYTVATGTQRFFPRLIVTDVEGRVGERAVAVDVFAPDDMGGETPPVSQVTVRIQISDPISVGSDINSGFAPLAVILSPNITGLPTDLGGLRVDWDLGDGNRASGLNVAHTYQLAGSFPITCTVTPGTGATTSQATRFITVLSNTPTEPPPPVNTNGNPGNGDGGTAGPLCGMGVVSTIGLLGLALMIRRLAD